MKTIKQWLDELSDPHKALALKNYYNALEKLTPERRQHRMQATATSICSAVARAFVWDSSIEGHDFWKDYQRDLAKRAALYTLQLPDGRFFAQTKRGPKHDSPRMVVGTHHIERALKITITNVKPLADQLKLSHTLVLKICQENGKPLVGDYSKYFN